MKATVKITVINRKTIKGGTNTAAHFIRNEKNASRAKFI